MVLLLPGVYSITAVWATLCTTMQFNESSLWGGCVKRVVSITL